MAYRNNYDDLLRDIQASGQSWSSYDLELAKENPDAGRSIFTQKQAWANAQTDAERRAANDAAELIRKQYGGYTGGSSGSGFTLDGTYTSSQKAPSYTQYTSKYQSQIDDLMAKLNNRPAFSYTPTDDPSYAAYSEHYRNAGDQAREDVLAQAAAMTGGQASSYAVAAAEQAQNAYNAQMSDVIPQLREAAYGRYMDEGNAMRNDLSTLLALDEAAYGRHQNDYANQMAEWEANYGVSRDLIEDKRYESELALAQAAAKAKQTGSGGGGGGTPVSDEPDYYGLYEAARASANPENFLLSSKNYKQYGITSSSGLLDGYKVWLKEQEEIEEQNAALANVKDYDSAMSYMKKMGVDSGIYGNLMNHGEWSRKKAAASTSGSGAASVTEFSTYTEYVRSYVQYALGE